MGFVGFGFVGILMGRIMANVDGGGAMVVEFEFVQFFFYGVFDVSFVIVIGFLTWVMLGFLIVILSYSALCYED